MFKINLYISLYNEKNSDRQNELHKCLFKNIKNSYIDAIHILLEPNDYEIFKSLAGFKKVFVYKIKSRPTYAMYFNIINQVTAPNNINIISNTDIYFDSSLLELKEAAINNVLNKNTCIALSHNEAVKRRDSQDAWVFLGSIDKKIDNSNIMLGIAGCDNVILHEIKKAGYKIINPSLTIKSYHMHSSNKRNYINNNTVTRYTSPPYTYGFIQPSYL